MDWLARDYVYPLRVAENHLLQVLLPRFSLVRVQDQFRLEVEFDDNSPTIRRREAKRAVQDDIPDFKKDAQRIQNDLIEVILKRSSGRYDHPNPDYPAPDFVFRYASGGTLPILQKNGTRYVCLFYRETFPVGWNIANGGCDTVSELIDPTEAIERELREELIILDLADNTDYVFTRKGCQLADRPEFDLARRLWQQRFSAGKPISDFRRIPLTVEWEDGPDVLTVKMGTHLEKTLVGCFLNINALDFGIEIDRVAGFEFPENMCLLDGEINDNRLLNRPIGLFEINGIKKDISAGVERFVPDELFHSGLPCRPQDLQSTVDRFLQGVIDGDRRAEEGLASYREAKQEDLQFDLCPVTRQIIERYELPVARTIGAYHSCFISYSFADERFAEQLRSALRAEGVPCWFAGDDMKIGDWIWDRLDSEIGRRDKLLLILSERSVDSPWVKDEVAKAFAEERKRNRAVLFPIRIDDAVMASDKAWTTKIWDNRYIGDFREWRDPDAYRKALERLLRDLKKQPEPDADD